MDYELFPHGEGKAYTPALKLEFKHIFKQITFIVIIYNWPPFHNLPQLCMKMEYELFPRGEGEALVL